MPESITIVGGSLAGLRGAETLRNDGFDGPITVIGDETGEPYDRPPLSKQLLAGKWEIDRTLLYRAERLAELDLDRMISRRIKIGEVNDALREMEKGNVVRQVIEF
jgi:NADPH-dependent 2,4-dienoyl-CoA reductase/sulfur reductase-like enzyme